MQIIFILLQNIDKYYDHITEVIKYRQRSSLTLVSFSYLKVNDPLHDGESNLY